MHQSRTTWTSLVFILVLAFVLITLFTHSTCRCASTASEDVSSNNDDGSDGSGDGCGGYEGKSSGDDAGLGEGEGRSGIKLVSTSSAHNESSTSSTTVTETTSSTTVAATTGAPTTNTTTGAPTETTAAPLNTTEGEIGQRRMFKAKGPVSRPKTPVKHVRGPPSAPVSGFKRPSQKHPVNGSKQKHQGNKHVQSAATNGGGHDHENYVSGRSANPDEEYRQLLAAATRNSRLDSSSGDCQGPTCEFRSKCGKAPLNSLTSGNRFTSYMINGERQKYGEWPSFTRLVTKWGAIISTCGGVLISDRHVMTAGHCLTNPNNHREQARANQIDVVLGEDRVGSRDAHEQTFGVSHACVSKKFDQLRLTTKPNSPESTRYDYAILTLNNRVTFNNYYQPACLPYNYANKTDTKPSPCFLVGTGVVGYQKDGQVIMSKTVEKMRMRQVSCQPYGFGTKDVSRDCYSKADNIGDSCSGDSGGPILCLDSKHWTVHSLVSYGSAKCNGHSGFGWTGAYARITTLLPLIKAECSI